MGAASLNPNVMNGCAAFRMYECADVWGFLHNRPPGLKNCTLAH